MTCLIFNSQAFCIPQHGTVDIHRTYSVTHFNPRALCTFTADILSATFQTTKFCIPTADIQCTYYSVGVIGIYRHFQHRFTYIMTTRLNLGKSTDRHKEMNGETTGIGKVSKNFNTLGELHARKVRGATLVTRSPRILCFVHILFLFHLMLLPRGRFWWSVNFKFIASWRYSYEYFEELYLEIVLPLVGIKNRS